MLQVETCYFRFESNNLATHSKTPKMEYAIYGIQLKRRLCQIMQAMTFTCTASQEERPSHKSLCLDAAACLVRKPPLVQLKFTVFLLLHKETKGNAELTE